MQAARFAPGIYRPGHLLHNFFFFLFLFLFLYLFLFFFLFLMKMWR